MISGGLPIIESLGFLGKEGKFSLERMNAMEQVEKDVVEGSFLSEALKKHVSIFPKWHIVYIHAASGRWMKTSRFEEDELIEEMEW